MKNLFAGALCAFGLTACASEPITADGTELRPKAFRPTAADASVTLACTVNDARVLDACVVVDETPAGRGFGALALEAVDKSRLEGAAGQPGDEVRFTMRFKPE